MKMTPNLWWTYDSEAHSFSSLPTGPFLLPALILLGLSVLWRGTFDRGHTIETVAGNLTGTKYWQEKRNRYSELVRKSAELDGQIDYFEQTELNELSRYLHNPYGHKL